VMHSGDSGREWMLREVSMQNEREFRKQLFNEPSIFRASSFGR
jgi:hypothetical protein